jgi:hypothetical protein
VMLIRIMGPLLLGDSHNRGAIGSHRQLQRSPAGPDMRPWLRSARPRDP